MNIRVTLMTKNDAPISALGDNPEKKIKQVWDAVATFLSLQGKDEVYVEAVEIVEDNCN